MRTASRYQSTPTAAPKLTVVVDGDTYTSEGAGGNERVIKVTTDEQPWGGQYLIELDNADGTLDAKGYEGEGITLNETFIGETADDYPPLWVHSQQFVSYEGKLRLQLNCVDLWTWIAAYEATLANASYNQQWQQESELSTRMMPDGSTLLSTGAPALYADLIDNGDKTIWEIIQDLASAMGVTVSLDDNDGYVNNLKPPISIGNARSGIRQLLDMTKCYLKLKTNGVLGTYQPDSHSTIFTFNTLNMFYSNVEEAGVTVPNKITFWAFNLDGDEWISGTAEDSDSYTKLGDRWVGRNYLMATLDTENKKSVAELTSIALGALDKIKAERNQGVFVAPNHVGLELFDKVSVVDNRYDTPRTTTGYIHRIIKEYDRGVYRISVSLGGVTGGYSVPGGADAKSLADAPPPTAPYDPADIDWTPHAAYLPVVIDIVFTADDHDTVSWSSGTIKAADGSVFTVNSGSKNLVNPNVFYAYYNTTTDDHVLDWTQTFGDTVTHERILVGFFKKTPLGEKALIVIGSQGKDMYIDVLSAITADLGLINAGEIRVGVGDLNAVGGTATGGGTTTLIDTGQSWTPDEWKDKTVRVIQGGIIEERTATGNTDTIITFAPALDSPVTNGTTYYLGGGAYTGWRLWVEAGLGRMGGYNVGDMQFYAGTDGKLYAGRGSVQLDVLGIKVMGQYLKFYDINGVIRGSIWGSEATALGLSASQNIYLDPSGGYDVIVSLEENDSLRPITDGEGTLGTVEEQWKGGYFKDRLKIPVGVDKYD